jgi:hypothetical protein
VALMIAVLILVALSSLLATLSVRVTMAKRRQAYMVEYQRARYALDSAMKYALSVMPMKTFALSNRAEVPDFSDLFWMSGDQYRAYLTAWAAEATDEQLEKVLKEGKSLTEMPELSAAEMLSRLASIFGAMTDDPNAPETATAQSAGEPYPDAAQTVVEIDPNDIAVPGPYGPAWPYVLKPIELEIGTAKVTITIEDENAKMPLAWAITNRQAVNKQAEAVLATFCDWMGMDKAEQETLAVQLGEIYTKKMFELNPSPILLPRMQRPAAPAAQPGRTVTSRPTTAQQRQAQQQAQAAQMATQERPAVAHATDFAKLFHSALLDRESLARPAAYTALPDESPLKYLALWGSQRVNVNTAPRQVLEAALTFGGDPVELVEKIIQKRKEAPIKSIDELKETFYSDSLMIDRAKDYLTTTSNFFLIRVVSHSGNARVSATATVIKEGRTVERLAILYGL